MLLKRALNSGEGLRGILRIIAVPLIRIDASTNKVAGQWVGKGGGSLRFGFNSLWLTDYKKGLLSRIPWAGNSAHRVEWLGLATARVKPGITFVNSGWIPAR